MPRISAETRRRIVAIKSSGYSVTQIQKRLADEDICVSKVTIYKLLKKYKEFRTVLDMPRRASVPRKLNADHVKFIDNSMAANDEITARQMRILLLDKWPSLQISLNTIKRTRKHLGWVATRPKYCQLVREANKVKRLNWCKESEEKGDQFDNVIWTDECSVQLDSHGRLCFRKKLQPRLAAFYQQTKNDFSIYGILKWSSVQLSKLKSSALLKPKHIIAIPLSSNCTRLSSSTSLLLLKIVL